MKSNALLFGLFLSLFAASVVGKEAWLPKSAGPPACFAGEPPRSSSCHGSGCHADYALNSGAATLLLHLDGAEDGYAPGQLYKLRVSLTRPGLQRGGFQFIALQDSKDTLSPGTFTLTDALRTQRIDRSVQHADTGCGVFSKVWIEHTEYGIDDPVRDTLSWQFDWVAPASDAGSITFYVAAVEANLDLDPTGDHVYSFSRAISSLPTWTAPPHLQEPVLRFPNPVSDQLAIGTDGLPTYPAGLFTVHDLAGRRLLEGRVGQPLGVAGLPSGIYLARVDLGGRTWTRKFVKE
jgi:hypothetical protein